MKNENFLKVYFKNINKEVAVLALPCYKLCFFFVFFIWKIMCGGRRSGWHNSSDKFNVIFIFIFFIFFFWHCQNVVEYGFMVWVYSRGESQNVVFVDKLRFNSSRNHRIRESSKTEGWKPSVWFELKATKAGNAVCCIHSCYIHLQGMETLSITCD